MKKISVIVPTFQHARTIGKSIESLLAQERKPDEIIVVDDGSTDNTKEVLETYKEKITYIYQANAGAPAARNNGFKNSVGDYVIFWDADVVGRSDMIKKLEEALNTNTDASWAYSDFYWGSKLFKSRPFNAEELKKDNYIHTSSIIKREDFPEFDKNIKRFQDWDLWLTMSKKGKKGVYVNDVLYRIVLDGKRVSISSWMPKVFYKIPWDKIGWKPKIIRNYEEARKVIERKHWL